MVKNIQGKAEKIGESGCYLLSLLYVTDRLDDVFVCYTKFLEKGFIDEDCFIKDPSSIMKALTGDKYTVKKSSTFDPKADFIIAYYYNPKTKYHHFVVHNKENKLEYDSFGLSNTVKNGYVESYRLFYKEV